MAIILAGNTDQPLLLWADYLPIAGVTATDSAAGTDPDDVLIATEDTVWRPANQTGAKSLTLNLVVARTAGALALLGSHLDGVSVEIRGSSDNFVAVDDQVLAATELSCAVNAAWLLFDAASYDYWRLTFTGFSSAFEVAHACLAPVNYLPYLASDWDGSRLDPEGVQLVSSAGLFVGSNQQRTMRKLPVDFGAVTETEFALLKEWADACVATMAPFFFVPDASADEVHFCWQDKPRFGAKRSGGLREVDKMTFTTRGA